MQVKFKVVGTLNTDGAVISEVGCETKEAADRQVAQLRMLYGDRNISIEIIPIKKSGGKRESK